MLLTFGILIAGVLGAVLARSTAPRANTSRSQFDAILVLGTPADSDGNPTPVMTERVTEAVHEYRRGVASHLIVSGAAAHNRFVEAEVMARLAEAQGVPPSAIVEETHALDTIQNACFSARILAEHRWHSVEVVSSPTHLPRAAMIFAHLASHDAPVVHLEWRMHAAPADLSPEYFETAAAIVETFKTARYLAWSRWIEPCGD
jgi:uncharacterized SAM-binding protein YcdF (DUF218 family)